VAAAAPQVMDHGQETRKNTIKSMKKSNQDKPWKGLEAKVAVTSVEAAERPLKMCKFAAAQLD
jgi:hypothetical protein